MMLPPSPQTVSLVPVERIRPGRAQARKRFDEAALRELAASIAESGVVQPLVLRPLNLAFGAGYEILAGERRWRAAQLAGLSEVPAIVRRDLGDEEAAVVGLIENLQRESLTPMEAAEGLKRLSERHGLTHEAIAARIGKSRVQVTHLLRLLTLDARVQHLVDDGRLSLGHAKVLMGLPAPQQPPWALEVVRHQLTVRALERRLVLARPNAPAATPPPAVKKNGDWRRLEQQLADQLGFAVALDADAAGRGALTLRFHSLDELDGLIARIGCRLEG